MQHTSEVLYMAADLIEQRGWTPGPRGMDVGTGPLCLMGAVGAAAGVTDTFKVGNRTIIAYDATAATPALQAVAAHVGVRPHRAYEWNDDQTNATPVVAALRAAAVIEAAKENSDTMVGESVGR